VTGRGDALLGEKWELAEPYDEFVQSVEHYEGLWHGLYRQAQLPDWAIERAKRCCKGAHLLVIGADWCWDAAVSIPILARLADETGCFDIRLIDRDEHPDLMACYIQEDKELTPVVIGLDEGFRELGYWGPQPRELRPWARVSKPVMEKAEFYKEMRRWHMRDKGESILREVLELFDSVDA
jgi:hypothetical protein